MRVYQFRHIRRAADDIARRAASESRSQSADRPADVLRPDRALLGSTRPRAAIVQGTRTPPSHGGNRGSNPRSGISQATVAEDVRNLALPASSGATDLHDRHGIEWAADERVAEIDGPGEVGERNGVAVDRERESLADVWKAQGCRLLWEFGREPGNTPACSSRARAVRDSAVRTCSTAASWSPEATIRRASRLTLPRIGACGRCPATVWRWLSGRRRAGGGRRRRRSARSGVTIARSRHRPGLRVEFGGREGVQVELAGEIAREDLGAGRGGSRGR